MVEITTEEVGVKTLKLSRTYVAFDKTFDTIRFREPTYKDIYRSGLGMPEEAQPNGHGGYVVITNYELIARYVDRLAIEPVSEALDVLNAADAMAVERVITGFFRASRAQT